jgi:HEAT repeat protein
MSHARGAVAALVCVGAIAALIPVAASQPATADDRLARAKAALSRGETQQAFDLIDEVLKSTPGRRDAAALKIETLSGQGDWAGAHAAYTAWRTASRKDDQALLVPVSRAVLLDIARTDQGLKAEALERLACAGDSKVLDQLKPPKTDQTTSPALDALFVLARFGDEAALAEVRRTASAGTRGARISALQTLERIKDRSLASELERALADTDPTVRLAAVTLARRSPSPRLATPLKALLEDRILLMRLEAAAALQALGDPRGVPLLEQALTSEFVDARLAAVRGLAPGKSTTWQPVAREILKNRDGLFRVDAAELLLAIDPQAATGVLREAGADPNPTVRGAVAAVLARQAVPMVDLLSTLVADSSPTVRLEAAGRLLNPTSACVP